MNLTRILILTQFLSVIPLVAFSQESQVNQLQGLYREVMDDPYLPVDRLRTATSKAYQKQSSNFFIIQVNTNDEGENIMGDAANEPSIAIDPLDPDRMVIGWRQFDTIASNFRQAGYGFTIDGGESWTFPSPIQAGVFRSDPVLDVDASGRFFYSSLTVDDDFNITMDVFRSTGDGLWDEGVFARGGDKQWFAIDRTSSSGEGHIYSTWTQAFSSCGPGFFVRSVDRGESYENCVTISNRIISFATLAVGPDGELYAGGFEGIRPIVARSDNAKDPNAEISWNTIRIVDLKGDRKRFRDQMDPNPGGLLGQGWIAVDHSDSPTRSNVYLLSSVERNDIVDPLDVMFSRSTDGGRTWSPAIRLNDDPSNEAWQWFGTMSVAPNGRIDVVWLDTRNDLDGYDSALYYTFSEDGGINWSVNEQLSETFDPHLGWPQQNKMGDYFDMVSDNNHAHLAWAGTFNGEQDVYYGRITPDVSATSVRDLTQLQPFVMNYPNPFTEETTIEYILPQKGYVQLEIVDLSGRVIHSLVNENQVAGKYTLPISSQLTSGVFICVLKLDNRRIGARKMIRLLP